MNKYYTPEIEEFHTGFEFEIWSDGYFEDDVEDIAGWYEYTFNVRCWRSLSDIEELLNDSVTKMSVRVKYLNQQDIEELGWSVTKDRDYEIDAQLEVSSHLLFEMTYDFEECELSIEKFFSNSLEVNPTSFDSTTIFNGTIKNKHELKKLMQMLNIKL